MLRFFYIRLIVFPKHHRHFNTSNVKVLQTTRILNKLGYEDFNTSNVKVLPFGGMLKDIAKQHFNTSNVKVLQVKLTAALKVSSFQYI